MDFFSSMRASATGLSAGRVQMNVVSQNLANSHTTRTPEGGPYQRKFVVLAPENVDEEKARTLTGDDLVQGVKLVEIAQDTSPFPTHYDPEHPDADENGMVRMPNVNPMTEMANLVMAKRIYDSNATALSTARSMAMKALEIGR